MSRERYVAAMIGALVALGIAFALVPGSLSLSAALVSAVLAITFERLAFA